MSTSEETDGLRPRYGCKCTLLYPPPPANLEMPCPGGRRSGPARGAPQVPPQAPRGVGGGRGEGGGCLTLLFPSAWSQPNYDFRVFYHGRGEREEEGGLWRAHNFPPVWRVYPVLVLHGSWTVLPSAAPGS